MEPARAIQALPALYAKWVEELLPGPIPEETEATCGDCAMCAPGEEPPLRSGYYFDPSVKCCSFIPELPNFLVGGILDDDPATSEGRRTLDARLAEGVGISPLGLGRHPTFQMLYEHLASVQGFGRSRTIRCPHYLQDSGRCSIWGHRESTCATWFCKHVRGELGKRFWAALQQLLFAIERELAPWCAAELDLGTQALRRLFASIPEDLHTDPIKAGELDGRPDPEARRANWGNWADREQEFYIESAGLVAGLSGSDVLQIGGTNLRILVQLAREARAELTSDTIPERLQAGVLELQRTSTDYTRVVTYSPCDPIEIPKAAMDVLHYFDGRPTRRALEAIAKETGLQVKPSMVRRLVDFGVLISTDGPPARS
jgi:hypothetical protein